jgi:hypothetical protein
MVWYQSGASAPFQDLDLGKPVPDATGTIVVDLNALLTSTPTAGVIYDARVAADGNPTTAPLITPSIALSPMFELRPMILTSGALSVK